MLRLSVSMGTPLATCNTVFNAKDRSEDSKLRCSHGAEADPTSLRLQVTSSHTSFIGRQASCVRPLDFCEFDATKLSYSFRNVGLEENTSSLYRRNYFSMLMEACRPVPVCSESNIPCDCKRNSRFGFTFPLARCDSLAITSSRVA